MISSSNELTPIISENDNKSDNSAVQRTVRQQKRLQNMKKGQFNQSDLSKSQSFNQTQLLRSPDRSLNSCTRIDCPGHPAQQHWESKDFSPKPHSLTKQERLIIQTRITEPRVPFQPDRDTPINRNDHDMREYYSKICRTQTPLKPHQTPFNANKTMDLTSSLDKDKMSRKMEHFISTVEFRHNQKSSECQYHPNLSGTQTFNQKKFPTRDASPLAIYNRNKDWRDRSQSRTQTQKEIKIKKELSECSFTPRISRPTTPRIEKDTTTKQFMEMSGNQKYLSKQYGAHNQRQELKLMHHNMGSTCQKQKTIDQHYTPHTAFKPFRKENGQDSIDFRIQNQKSARVVSLMNPTLDGEKA